MAYNEDSSASGHDEPWIQWFCGLKGHEMFCEVERAYIEDGFNLYGLRACVPNFSDCLDLILDRIGPDDSDDSHLTQSACTLYGLIHARYIITAHGLDAMYNKYAAKEFGTCPLLQCGGQPVLPVGIKDEIGAENVKVFCPKCNCVYHPPPSRSRGGIGAVDGASFGTTFPHLFLMTFSNLVPDALAPESVYVPRVFGFRIHKSARQRNSSSRTKAIGNNSLRNNTTSMNISRHQLQTATNNNAFSTSNTNVAATTENTSIKINNPQAPKLQEIQSFDQASANENAHTTQSTSRNSTPSNATPNDTIMTDAITNISNNGITPTKRKSTTANGKTSSNNEDTALADGTTGTSITNESLNMNISPTPNIGKRQKRP